MTKRNSFMSELPGRSASAGARSRQVDGAAFGLNSGVANGARPTSSSGGPSAASRRTASRSSPRSGGSVAHTASTTEDQGERRSRSESRSSSRPARWSSISSRPSCWSIVAAYSSTTQRWSGSSASDELEAGLQVGLLEAEQRHAALAGVPVGEVGEEEVAATTVVEGLDVVLLQLVQRRGLQVAEELLDRGAGSDPGVRAAAARASPPCRAAARPGSRAAARRLPGQRSASPVPSARLRVVRLIPAPPRRCEAGRDRPASPCRPS